MGSQKLVDRKTLKQNLQSDFTRCCNPPIWCCCLFSLNCTTPAAPVGCCKRLTWRCPEWGGAKNKKGQPREPFGRSRKSISCAKQTWSPAEIAPGFSLHENKVSPRCLVFISLSRGSQNMVCQNAEDVSVDITVSVYLEPRSTVTLWPTQYRVN